MLREREVKIHGNFDSFTCTWYGTDELLFNHKRSDKGDGDYRSGRRGRQTVQVYRQPRFKDGHFDHVMAVPEVTKKYGIKAYAHEDEAEVMVSPYLNGCEMIGARVSVKPDDVFADKARLVFGDILFEVIFTPGHTQGGVCFYMPQVKKLLCGDTLFEASVGRTDLPTGSMSTLIRSIRERLFVLDDDVEALPGHGPSTTIGYEKKYNPFL